MRTRIISAIAALLLLGVVMFLGKEALGTVVFMVAVIGIYEIYGAFEKGGFKPVRVIGYISCLPLLYLALGDKLPESIKLNNNNLQFKLLALLIFLVLMFYFCLLIFKHEKYKIDDIAVSIFGILYVVFLFAFIILVRNISTGGELYIWLVFIGAWIPDTAAYFTGVTIGKTKILPVISPKKSLEGSIGGIVGCVLVMAGVGLFFNTLGINAGKGIPLYHYVIIGILCGIISQIGDWAASAIKRYVNIKDYGNIMPGHGGVLDRFDSILFAGPVVYFYIGICLGI